MSRTITAFFDQRSDAEAAKERLRQANLDTSHVSIHDKSSQGFNENSYSTRREPGMWGSIKNAFLPDEDRHTYEEGVRRGGYLLTADVDEQQVDEAVRVLEQANSVDMDSRSSEWRQQGWAYTGGGNDTGGHVDYGSTSAERTGASTTGAFGQTATGTNEAIPIVEEELVVGKREVERGSVRVRSYITERPVHEQIRLRNERVQVERHAVDRPLSDADDAFRERTIDVHAMGEEAVVGKTARVVEEVVVSKTSEERVEEIDDSVRRTEVDIDNDTTTTGTTGTTGLSGDRTSAGRSGSDIGYRD